MANRKVLINRHTSGNTAPTASEMYLGEIAIAHETGKETIFTKNNAGDMVPFVSCAQTIAMINNLVEASEDDVKAGTDEQHLEVATASTGDVKTWTITTKDVQSEEEFKAYSARTNDALTALTSAFDTLLDITVTGISGDTIIVAEPVENGTGSSNSYNLTHKQALATDGFKKLTTDAYGHVTAATDVTTADIQALGFKTSAQTGEDLEALSASVVTNKTNIEALSGGTIHDIETLSGDVVEYVKVVSGNIETVINELSAGTIHLSADTHNTIVKLSGDTEAAISKAIEDLGSVSATTGKYFTAIGVNDGTLVMEEEDLPTLAVESAGTGNVVSQITVDGHKITYQTASVATSEGIAQLSAATIALSAGTVHDLDELSGATEAISGYAHDEIAQLSAGTIQLSADTKNTIDALSAGTIQLSADTKAAIDELAGKAVTSVIFNGAETVANNVATITETKLSSATTGAGNVVTDIAVNDHEITFTKGITALTAVTATGDSYLNASVAGNSAISISLANVADAGTDITNASTTGAVADAYAVKEYVNGIVSSSVNYKGATSSVPAEAVTGDLYIADSTFTVDGKNVEVGDFIIYDGTKWDVIEKNLDGAITGNLTANTVTLGNGLNEVTSLANGSNGQVLTIGTAGTPVWADDPVLSTATTGNGNVVSEITVNDHEITYVKNFTAATNADLEIVSGIVDTFSAATVAEFNSAFTAINTLSADAHNSMIARDDAVFSSAVTYVDEQIDEVYASAVSYADSAITYAIEGLDSTGSVSTTGHYLTSVTITDGKITAVGEEEVPAATPVTTVAGTTGDTAAAVLSEIVTGGTDGHQLTLNMTNKVFSATTADSALTSESALTAVHADAAAKVDSALTVNILTSAGTTASTHTFDGSSNAVIDIPGSHDTATTQEGHYVPATAASAFTAPAGSFLSGVSVDDKNHVLEVAYADKINSATTSESADTAASADKVANALSVSGYSTSSASSLDSAIAYDGSEAKSLTFGTVGNAGLNSMSMTSTGVVDVEVIDCGTY